MPRRGPSNTTFAPQTLTCRILGCRFRFAAEEATLRWWCDRGCPSGGAKAYAQADEARRMAAALDREPRSPANVLALLGGTIHRDRDRDRSAGAGGGAPGRGRPDPDPPTAGDGHDAPAADRPAPPGYED